MQEPEPVSALRLWGANRFAPQLAGLALEERPFVGKLSIRGRAADWVFASRFRDIVGIDPPVAGVSAEVDTATLLPVGPTEWLAVDHHPGSARSRPATDSLRERLIAAGLIAIDVSSATTIIRVSGADLHPTMRKLAALPLDRMFAGSVARTRIGKLAILVHVLAAHRIDLFVARSLAQSFLEQLQGAAELRQ